MRFIFILFINITYCLILLNHPKSEISNIDGNVIDHYTENISKDTGSYLNPGSFRTIGYGYILRLPFKSILILNCFLGAWLFYIVFDMIGRKAWLLAFLGAFTVYVPILYTDLLFATIFITAIWMIRKNIWIHFLLLGIASLVRPSLAWFFLIEPVVLWYYRKEFLWWSAVVVFVVTSFSPIRNYILYNTWTHSTVLRFNIESDDYYGGRESTMQYFKDAFKANYLSGHYDYAGAMYNKYKRDSGDKEASRIMWVSNIICVLINLFIWLRFTIRILQRKVNWGNVIMVCYFVVPTLFGAAGARLRLPIEWMLL